MSTSKRLLLAIPILWLGFVLSISFMEAWLKFRAEGVTLAIGLSIGRIVFASLNKTELFFFLVLLISGIKERNLFPKKKLKHFFLGLAVILFLQSFHLLPSLDHRAELIINGANPQSSYFHFYYIFLEVVKVIILGLFVHQMISKLKISDESNDTMASKDPIHNPKSKYNR